MSTSRNYTCRFFRQGFQSEQRRETLMDSPEVGLSQTWCAWQKLRKKGEVRAQPCWELRAEVPRAPRNKGDLPWQRCSAKTTIPPSIPTSHPKPIWRDTKPPWRHPVPLFPDFWGHGEWVPSFPQFSPILGVPRLHARFSPSWSHEQPASPNVPN